MILGILYCCTSDQIHIASFSLIFLLMVMLGQDGGYDGASRPGYGTTSRFQDSRSLRGSAVAFGIEYGVHALTYRMTTLTYIDYITHVLFEVLDGND